MRPPPSFPAAASTSSPEIWPPPSPWPTWARRRRKSPSMRARAKFRILAEALGPGGRAAVLCEGRDVYGLTARFLVAAAQKVSGAGAMAPAEALDPVPFFDAVTYEDEHGAFSWRRLS